MHVDLFTNMFDRLSFNGSDDLGCQYLWVTAWKGNTIVGDLTIELDEASRRQLRNIVRQWDRDDEAKDRADEVGSQCDAVALLTLDGPLPCLLDAGHDGPHVPYYPSHAL